MSDPAHAAVVMSISFGALMHVVGEWNWSAPEWLTRAGTNDHSNPAAATKDAREFKVR